MARDINRLAILIEGDIDNVNKEITIADQEEGRRKLEDAHDKQLAQWQELSKAHSSHWRAWGSWFSWGSPVGLGIFILLLGVTFAIFKWAISL